MSVRIPCLDRNGPVAPLFSSTRRRGWTQFCTQHLEILFITLLSMHFIAFRQNEEECLESIEWG